jgi:hypothetical protein
MADKPKARYSMSGGYKSSGGIPQWAYEMRDMVTGAIIPCKSWTCAGAYLDLAKRNESAKFEGYDAEGLAIYSNVVL